MMRPLLVLFTALFLSACAGGSGPAADTYILSSPTLESSARKASYGTLKIVLPVTNPGLDSTRIAVLESQGHLRGVEGKAWAETLPKMVQAGLVEAFESSGRFRSVIPDMQGAMSDYSLLTDIRAFQLIRDKSAARVEVKLVGRVVDPLSRKVRFSVSSTQSVPTRGNTLAATLAAFETAHQTALRELVEKTLSRL